MSLFFHDFTTRPKFLTPGKIVVSGNNKLPRNTKMFLFPVLYISNTFLSILADHSSADVWIKVIDVSTPISFKLPFNRNGTVPKDSNTIGTTLVFTSHILLSSLARFWYFSTFSAYIIIIIIIIIVIIITLSVGDDVNVWITCLFSSVSIPWSLTCWLSECPLGNNGIIFIARELFL